jgi:hypothetical protein
VWAKKAKEDGLDDEFIESERPKIMKPVESFGQYDSYGRKCLYNLNPDKLKIQPYNIFDPHKFRKYFPIGNSAMFYGGEMITESRDMNIDRREKSFWEVNAFLMSAAGIGMIALLIAWLAPLGT